MKYIFCLFKWNTFNKHILAENVDCFLLEPWLKHVLSESSTLKSLKNKSEQRCIIFLKIRIILGQPKLFQTHVLPSERFRVAIIKHHKLGGWNCKILLFYSPG